MVYLWYSEGTQQMLPCDNLALGLHCGTAACGSSELLTPRECCTANDRTELMGCLGMVMDIQ